MKGKILLLLALFLVSPSLLAMSWGAVQYSGFENGTNDAFAEEGVISPSGFWPIMPDVGARSGDYALYGEFHEDNYDGRRATRSLEIKSDTSISSGKRATKNGWLAASIYIPASGVENTDTIILQLLSYVSGTSQTKCFSINLTPEGKLGIRGYHTTTTDPVQTSFSYQVPAGVFQYDSWNDIIVSFQFSKEKKGFVNVWVNPAKKDTPPTYRVEKVNLGSSEFWDGDTLLNGVYGKAGLYASDYTQYAGRIRKIMIDEFRFYSTLAEATLEDFLIDTAQAKRWRPGHYMLVPENVEHPEAFCTEIASEDKVRGLMVRFNWNDIETQANQFNWSDIDEVLDTCGENNKLVFLSLIDRFSSGVPDKEQCLAPQYVKKIEGDTGCMPIQQGGMPAFYKKSVTDKYIRLIKSIAARYDSHKAFGGIQVAESAVGSFAEGTRPNDFSKAAYAEQLKRIYWEGAHALERGVFIAGLNWLSGEIEGLVDSAAQSGVGIGGPGIYPYSCTANSTDAQEYLTSIPDNASPVMFQIQAPEMNGQQGYCSVLELADEGKRLGMSHYFWIRMWEHEESITWENDILPAIREGLDVQYGCPEAFTNGCKWN